MGHRARFMTGRQTVHLASGSRTLRTCVVLSFLLSVSPVSAATDIQGAADHLRLTARNATIAEILGALSARFKFGYTVRAHGGRPLTGSYSGTLRETLTRVLDGYDYILNVSDSGLDVVVLGASNLTAGSAPIVPSSQVTATSSKHAGTVNPNPSLSPSSPPPLSNYASQNGPAEPAPFVSGR